jgi:hypothetical protein
VFNPSFTVGRDGLEPPLVTARGKFSEDVTNTRCPARKEGQTPPDATLAEEMTKQRSM